MTDHGQSRFFAAMPMTYLMLLISYGGYPRLEITTNIGHFISISDPNNNIKAPKGGNSRLAAYIIWSPPPEVNTPGCRIAY
jgi:hypothetical protein